MTVTINAVSGTGLTTTSDGSGVVKVQSNGVTTNALAWVNFAGASGTINASYNVSSVTRSGTGSYTVNFANALADANYVASVQASLTNYYVFPGTNSASSATTTAFNPGGFYVNGSSSAYSFSLGDPTTVRIAIFGN